jgi:hypothetical protein
MPSLLPVLLPFALLSATQSTTAPAPPPPIAPAHLRIIVEKIEQKLVEAYPFPDISKRYASRLRESLAQHRYNGLSAKALGKAITQDLQGVHRDHHLDVFASADYFKQALEESGEEPTPAGRAREIEDGRAVDFGFTAVDLDATASVAYIASRTQWFDNQEALEMAAHAMNMASYSKNIIIDLRGNPGGSGRMGRFLASYFFQPGDEKYYLYGFPKDRTKAVQEWTYAYVPGRRSVDSRLYILIDHDTGSACEGFAFAMQKLGRATVVGDTSAGAGIAGSLIPLLDDMVMFLPDKMIVAPTTQAGWEGVGVKPDIEAAGRDARVVAREVIAKNSKP